MHTECTTVQNGGLVPTMRNNVPWKSGHIFHVPTPPTPMNWPSEASRKNSGTPPTRAHMTYGIRKPPRTRCKQVAQTPADIIFQQSLFYIFVWMRYVLKKHDTPLKLNSIKTIHQTNHYQQQKSENFCQSLTNPQFVGKGRKILIPS
jgi:hypothetical protein